MICLDNIPARMGGGAHKDLYLVEKQWVAAKEEKVSFPQGQGP